MLFFGKELGKRADLLLLVVRFTAVCGDGVCRIGRAVVGGGGLFAEATARVCDNDCKHHERDIQRNDEVDEPVQLVEAAEEYRRHRDAQGEQYAAYEFAQRAGERGTGHGRRAKRENAIRPKNVKKFFIFLA